MFFNWYLSNEKTAFVDKSRVEPTIFFIEKISFTLKLFSGHFYGQSFIKTVRGPWLSYDKSLIHFFIGHDFNRGTFHSPKITSSTKLLRSMVRHGLIQIQ